MKFTFDPIGIVRSCFTEKFGIPRQSGLVPDAAGVLELLPPYNKSETVRGLEGFSHIWITYVFHENAGLPWKGTVRPPRLGGNRRIGVFASRSGFRPNPIGISAVEIGDIRKSPGKIEIDIKGIDILDNTPVLDIKPYIPYADALVNASAGFAPCRPERSLEVIFQPEAEDVCRKMEALLDAPFKQVVTDCLALDPRPAYRLGTEEVRTYGFGLYGAEVKWKVEGNKAIVLSVDP